MMQIPNHAPEEHITWTAGQREGERGGLGCQPPSQNLWPLLAAQSPSSLDLFPQEGR